MALKGPLDTIALMRQVPLFAELADSHLRALYRACRTMTVPAGSHVFSPSEKADRFYVILSGRVKLYKLSSKGEEQILHIYGQGGTFGEAAMWAGIRFPAYAEALEDSALLVVPKSVLRDAVARDGNLAMAMMAGMSAKLQEFNRLIEQLSLKEVPARLADVLLSLSRKAGSDTIRLKQTKRQLASQIGTAAETLSRAFAKLKSMGLIRVSGARITILDPEGMAELAAG